MNDGRRPPHPAQRVNRGKPIVFSFEGRPIQAYEGESVAAALYAHGVRTFSRSFKYHRPRGLLCVAGRCPNCLMEVDGSPNVRTCIEPARHGMRVRGQHAWPSLDKVIVSANLHVYVSQTDRGELVIGSEIDPYSSYSYKSTLPFLEATAAHTLELFPCLREVRVLRQWTGVCDMTQDYSPIMGEVPGLKGFILDVGWGTYGFKAGPVSGKRIAELIATGKTPDVLKPFSITRFWEERLVGEKAAAAVSH